MSFNEDSSTGSEIDTDNDEDIDDEERTLCLFCDVTSDSVDLAIQHLDTKHGITLSALKSKFHMDQYSFIKVRCSTVIYPCLHSL